MFTFGESPLPPLPVNVVYERPLSLGQPCTTYSALALVISKIKVGTTVKPIWSRPQFFIKTWSYMSGELRECSNFKNLFVKIYKNLGFLGQSGL